MEWMDGLVDGRRTCWRRRVSKQCLMHRHANFSVGLEIGACGCVGMYFPARLTSEGRSEGGAPVGVFFSHNGGRQKISPVKVVDGKVF